MLLGVMISEIGLLWVTLCVQYVAVIQSVYDICSSPLPSRGREGFTRLQAAKDFFEAFANRSQAYDFHHSMGLTTFHSSIAVVQPLSRIYEFFRVSGGNRAVLFFRLGEGAMCSSPGYTSSLG